MISCVVFDFDDTLVESEEYKLQTFFDIAGEFDGGILKMQAIFKNPERGDRFQIMKTFAQNIGKELIADKLAEDYTNKVENYIKDCLEVRGAEQGLKALQQQGFSLYINSATPEKSLIKTIKNRKWHKFFKGILGGHNQKVANLKKIAFKEKCQAYNIAMVGDGEADREAAEVLGCMFIGLERGLAKYKKPVKLIIKDITELISIITEANLERKR